MKEPRVIKTIKNKDIPRDVKKKAIKEARLIAKKKLGDFDDVGEILGFTLWSDTPSGHDFWRKITDAEDIR